MSRMAPPTGQHATTSTVILRPADQRFHSQLDWLDSWHSFSFGSHQDPNWMGFGPLRVINDDTIAAGQGFGMHPHRDMEIITVMVEGALSHADSMGNRLQIWIEPAQLGIQPAYEQKPFAIGEGWTPLIEPNATGDAMAIERPVRLWRAQPQRQQQLPLPAAKERLLWLQVIDGELTLNREGSPKQALRRGDGVGLIQDTATQGELIGLGERADVLLFALA